MVTRSVFEIIGPMMIGPSSSHTAGAVRIGRFARTVLDERPVSAKIVLYGSFAKTYKGHGTDKALVGGLLGMDTDNESIKEALAIAKKTGLEINLELEESFDLHPNTVGIFLTGCSGKKVFVEGSSIGGGNILISKINEFEVNIHGRLPALLVEHEDKPGAIGRVTTFLGENGINIAEMKMARTQKGANNFMVIETDHNFSDSILDMIKKLPSIVFAIKTEPI